MDIWIIWLIIASLLLVTEILTQMMWALCLTVGALGAMICALCGVGIAGQTAVLAISSAAAYVILLPLFRKWHSRSDSRRARTGMDALLGRKAIVTEPVLPGRCGRARIDGDNWQVKAPGIDGEIPVGAEVTVTDYDSIILTVTIERS